MIKIVAGTLLDAGDLLAWSEGVRWREGLLDSGVDVAPRLRHDCVLSFLESDGCYDLQLKRLTASSLLACLWWLQVLTEI